MANDSRMRVYAQSFCKQLMCSFGIFFNFWITGLVAQRCELYFNNLYVAVIVFLAVFFVIFTLLTKTYCYMCNKVFD